MLSKETILHKIQILITNHFETPEDAFAFFDKDGDGKLNKAEIVKLLKDAEITGFIRGMVSSKLIEGYDKDGDDLISWKEFKSAIDEITEESK
ncbi:EF-hand domain-containing protein [Winogradskyella psychrotolerans]|jgi:Ca2+-binding EF-hand superfamily protein|uniref:EF hand domain-containing protein n=2 Tax=Winogradskyella TaxID=286104 RepID=A0A3D9H002_9FLAO|nr:MULTISPECIES: EF-hand domain-containing protein [Winogradskyella]MBU2920601.1 EF-hand domain-containing protein [Winogradskyella psychrotolerans]RED42828.1 EF hand domain-containing protein [Winogradskyella eximia]